MGRLARSIEELEVYQAAFSLQQEVFFATKSWPSEERYSLTDQVRRSSRSIGANLSEAWAKRRYPAHFASKLTDADGEALETQHWLKTALACGYLTVEIHQGLQDQAVAIGRMLGAMLRQSDSFAQT